MKNLKPLYVSTIVAMICGFILNYLSLPAWNLRSSELWWYFFTIIGIFDLVYWKVAAYINDKESDFMFSIPIGISSIFVIAFIICGLTSSVLFNAQRYSELVRKEVSDWDTDMEEVKSVSNIALMDTDTAKVFGERKLGSLSDIVSQYDLSDTYTQINLNGVPMKIAPLEYDTFWKWYTNKIDGIPGYVLVDPVNNDSEFVRLEQGIKFSPSERFGHDLWRTLRRKYPSDIFYEKYFEIDDEGNPWWIISVMKPTIGVFGGKVITDVIIMNPFNGDCEKIAASDVPDWVDVVYDGDYITQRVNWNGMYQRGFWNYTLFSAIGCTKCTDDYGYVTIDNDIWIYTGITSASGDASNIGVILANERTCEIKYYEIAGADEASAMAAAEGEVQQYGYTASFPSIINVNGEATYIMVLVDANNIVKEYAMVNVANYSKVVVAETQEEVFAAYAKKMGFTDLIDDTIEVSAIEEEPENVNYITESISVNYVQFIVIGGNTMVYITASDGQVYKTAFYENFIVDPTASLEVMYADTENGKDVIVVKSFKVL